MKYVIGIAGLIVIALAFWTSNYVNGARAEALREAGRAERLAEERRTFEAAALEATEAWRQSEAVRMQVESELATIRMQARAEAVRANRAVQAASQSVRTILDSLGASTASLDSLEAAHAQELAAVRLELAGVEAWAAAQAQEIEALRGRCVACDSLVTALQAEHASKDRQIALLERAANPPLLGRLAKEGLKIGLAVGAALLLLR